MPGEELGRKAQRGLQGTPTARQSRFRGVRLFGGSEHGRLRRSLTTRLAVQRDLNSVPRHVAIVMDGNGRWAKKRFMPRFFGHKQGVDSLVRCVQACSDRGIEYLTEERLLLA